MKKLIAMLMCAVFFAVPVLAENAASVTIDLQFGSQTYTDEIDVRWNGDAADDLPVFYGTLREGDTGRRVRELQEMLKKLFLYDGEIDGIFGPETAAAVRAFQHGMGHQHGLQENGIADAAFYTSLYWELFEGATLEVAAEDSFGIITGGNVCFYNSYNDSRAIINRLGIGNLFIIKQKVYFADTYWYYVDRYPDHKRGYILADMLQTVTEAQFKAEIEQRDENFGDIVEYEDYVNPKVIGKIKIKEGHRVFQYTTDAIETSAQILARYLNGPATIDCIEYTEYNGRDYYQTKEGYYIYDNDLWPDEKIAKGFIVVRNNAERVETHSGPGNDYPIGGALEKGKAYPYVDIDDSVDFWYQMRDGNWINTFYISYSGRGDEWHDWENYFNDFNRTLSFGDKDRDVYIIKEWLLALRYLDDKDTVGSATYDEKTRDAVKRFQKDNGLPQIGSCDVETKKKLLEAFRTFMAN